MKYVSSLSLAPLFGTYFETTRQKNVIIVILQILANIIISENCLRSVCSIKFLTKHR